MSALSEHRSEILAMSPLQMLDRILELETRDDLAHEIAEDAAKGAIDGMLGWRDDGRGGRWFDLNQPTEVDGAQFYIDRAVRYLEEQGVLKRCPSDSQLIG